MISELHPNIQKGENKMKYFVFMILVIMLSGCADEVSFSAADKMTQVGFWYGLWHGMIILVSFIISLFSDSTTIYAIYNNGGWYNFGFVSGICILLGSSSLTISK